MRSEDHDNFVPWRVFSLSAVLFSSIVAALCTWGIAMSSNMARQAAVQEAQAMVLQQLVGGHVSYDEILAAIRERVAKIEARSKGAPQEGR